MKDTFDKVMERFLVPMAEFKGPVMDSTYFLRKDGGFVFSEGYCHPPGALWGMIIKYPHPEGHIDVFGRRYSWTHREYIDGELRIVPNRQQLENQFKVAPELRNIQGDKPPFARNFVKFPLSGFQGYFDSRRSLRLLRQEYGWIDKAVSETCRLLNMNEDSCGVTGSLAYGRVEDDIDLMIIGRPEENARVARKIRRFIKDNPESRVTELGKVWPLRFYFAGTLICPFFRYARPEDIPLFECRMELLEEEVEVEAAVSDDLHNLYLPVVLALGEVKSKKNLPKEELELIIYDGSLRGEVHRGDRLRLRADLVSITEAGKGSRRALLVTDPEQLVIG